MKKVIIKDEAAFIAKYPKLVKTVPAQTVPDYRKIGAFLKLGGSLDGVAVVEKMTDKPDRVTEKEVADVIKEVIPTTPKPVADADPYLNGITAKTTEPQTIANLEGTVSAPVEADDIPALEGETVRDHHARKLKILAEREAAAKAKTA